MILAILTLALSSTCAPGDVTVELPMQAAARGTEIELAEIATVTGADAATVARVQGVVLGNAPAPGFSRLLHAHRIAQTLDREVPGVRVELRGHKACRVVPETVSVGRDDLIAAARQELTTRFAGQDVTFEVAADLQPLTVPAGATAPVLRVRMEEREPRPGTIGVPVQVLVDDTPYRTVWTSWKVQTWEVLPVLARGVTAGERLQPFHLERRRVAVDPVRGRALPASMLAGAIAARDLAAGAPITDLDVHRPAVVTLGDSLFLEVKNASITARVPAVALESGSVGDRIRVRALSTEKEHTATVASADLVRIELAPAPQGNTPR